MFIGTTLAETLVRFVFMLTGTVTVLFWSLFSLTGIREKKPRAALLSGLFSLVYVILWFGGYFFFHPPVLVLLIFSGIIFIFVALFFLPMGRIQGIQFEEITEKIDERDVIFAREEYISGTEKYNTYYERKPELKQIDDKIRSLPELLSPGGKYYDPIRSRYTASIFKVIESLLTAVDGPVNPFHSVIVNADTENSASSGDTGNKTSDRASISLAEMTATIKQLTLHLGAADVGVACLDPAFVYSHIGRGPESWGAPIVNDHKYVIAFALEMDYEHVETAPRIPITEESAREYLMGATISITLAEYIRQLGYPARAHIAGSNYQIVLPPVAHAAGLGELGRFGYLISSKHGARIRLGAVTTDLPLIPDTAVNFGVQDFCDRCKRCAENCPSGSIPHGEKTVIKGVEKWPLEVETCLHYWRYIGTDCGLCMKVCPYSHPRTLVHDLVRFGISRSCFARAVSVLGEDLFYGRKPGRKHGAAARR